MKTLPCIAKTVWRLSINSSDTKQQHKDLSEVMHFLMLLSANNSHKNAAYKFFQYFFSIIYEYPYGKYYASNLTIYTHNFPKALKQLFVNN